MNPIDELFRKLRERGRKAFMPFVTAGDPSMEATSQLIHELAGRGADLIEIGFPYSDPIADGPVIQASYTRALDRKLRLDDIFSSLRLLSASPAWAARKVPLVGMTAYSLVLRKGPEAFVREALGAGLSGLIVPDLPVDECAELSRFAAERDLKLILLVTPTTPRDRAARIAAVSTGFLYCVSVTGITGERDELPQPLLAQLAWLRQQTKLPLCVGFGISKPEHVRRLRDLADGVIVGSALVRHLETAATRALAETVQRIGEHAQSLAAALNE